tara:strand:- start:59 stop:574 length:516 start_codon:yes stop_codon:yes gene_type:complete
MSDIIIQDNFLDKDYFENIKNTILSPEFPWYMRPTLDPDGPGNPKTDYQMTHVAYFFDKALSPLYGHLTDMGNKMGVFVFTKVKVNLNKRTETSVEAGYHVDMAKSPPNALTSVFYLNTNNGYTKFETGEIVESVANRLVTFPQHIQHTGATNTCDEQYRCVLNLNWLKAA